MRKYGRVENKFISLRFVDGLDLPSFAFDISDDAIASWSKREGFLVLPTNRTFAIISDLMFGHGDRQSGVFNQIFDGVDSLFRGQQGIAIFEREIVEGQIARNLRSQTERNIASFDEGTVLLF